MSDEVEPVGVWGPAPELRVAAWAAALAPQVAGHGEVIWPGAAPRWSGLPDNNRTLVLPEVGVPHAGGRWMLSVKGVGARFLPFGDGLDGPGDGRRLLTADCWFGEAPWGAQGDSGAADALRWSDRAQGRDLWGMPICPVLEVVRLPDELVRQARPASYRTWRGGWWQEHRLVPSTLRLFQGDRSFAEAPEAALRSLGVEGADALDAFIERFLQTGLAALTLPARAARDGRTVGWSHVWLDKDAVLAPDGSLCFADLEGLVEVPVGDSLAAVARRHLDDHVYEWLYAVHHLLAVAARWRGRRAAVRDELEARLRLALLDDPYAAWERGAVVVGGVRLTLLDVDRGGADAL